MDTISASPSSRNPYSLPRKWIHNVFPSFHGPDVCKSFLSHFLKECKSKGIDPFIDNEIIRGEFIGPELKKAIQGSRIAIVMLSKRYASSSWCLDELVEIMKCTEDLGYTVMVIFYEVDPTNVKKQIGEFGKVFEETCQGKKEEVIRRWSQALAEVATIAGYHSSKWDKEAEMIEKIVTDVSKMLNNSTSRDFEYLVGMETHMEKMRPLLCLDLDEVRMIGIWGTPGIGKTTIAKFLFNQHSKDFQLSVFMANIKRTCTIPDFSDDNDAKLLLQQKFLSQILKEKDIEVPHLGVAQDRLKDKRVLVVLDDVDQLVQLEAMAKETGWFGRGSRIIITTQDQKLLKDHGINHIYEVPFPPSNEALQMFCTYAFGQSSPKDGFRELAKEVTSLVDSLPLGLQVMGSYFKELSQEDWSIVLRRFEDGLDKKIESILRFRYDALSREDGELFIHIACFFNNEYMNKVVAHLEKSFPGVSRGLHVLAKKSLISIDQERIGMHSLLAQLGKEIGKRQFLMDGKDICEVLTDPTADTRSVIGISSPEWDIKFNITERAFEGMPNLQFLRLRIGKIKIVSWRKRLKYISPKLQLLDWEYAPITCLRCIINTEFLVELNMRNSKLEKLWEGIKPLQNLKGIDLSFSKNLKKLPNLSTATNLQKLVLCDCSSLVELPSSVGNATNLKELDLSWCSRLKLVPSIGNATNLQKLDLGWCSSLVELPSSIGNATNLQELVLYNCSSLVELPSSIGNAINLQKLDLGRCSSLMELPSSIGNATNLQDLNLSWCYSLMELPSFVGNLQRLTKLDLEWCSKLEVLPTSINLESLKELNLTSCMSLKRFPEISTNIEVLKLSGSDSISYYKNLKEYPHAFDNFTELRLIDLPEIGSWVKGCSHLHNVFPSFHGPDVRKSFLSHFLKECKSKGIDPFIDNEITRGEFVGPELKKAIHGSRIAIVLLSKRYASSSWCLDELVEIMECNEVLGYTVMVIFYEVNPSDVKKQTGDFGKVFKKTCKGKTKETIGRWSQALAKVATIAGYDSSNSENDVKLIEEIVTAVSDKLFSSTRSKDFDGFVGIEAHMEKMEQVLDLRSDLDKVKMVGVWGPPGIGKTTIARCVFKKHSGSFDLSVFMTNVKAMHAAIVCSDDYDAKLNLQQKFLSQITNQKEDFKITHLGAAQERLHDKRVLVVLDNVDQLVQLEALANEACWFGHGSRIIVTTQDQNLLRTHGINHVYKVGVPTNSLEIFCMYAFKQKSPAAGFENLAREVTVLAGELPLALKVLGSSLRGKSKEQWEDALPSLRSSLDGEIESILKCSYDALSQREKDVFLHLTCFFNSGSVASLEVYLAKIFSDFRQGLDVLIDKSLISVNSGNDPSGFISINSLLVQLGKEIVRKEYGSEPGIYSIRKPGERQFLLDACDICQVLSDDTTDSSSVIGIDLTLSKTEDEMYLSERAFERMSNLKFLKIYGECDRFSYPQILNSISRKLRLLVWENFPMPCLPTNFDPKLLITLRMEGSKLEKLWDGVKPLRNLKEVDLRVSKNLKELPDLSTATNLETLLLSDCSSLVELPSSIGNATNLQDLYLDGCSSLVKLPSSIGNVTNLSSLRLSGCSSLEELPPSIGNATNLEELILDDCSKLVELPFSVGNLHKLLRLIMQGCTKLKILPNNINLESLEKVYLSNCSLLKRFPEISTNISYLDIRGTAIEEVPPSISLWSRLDTLHMSYCVNLKESPHAFDSVTELHLTDTGIQEIGPWVKEFARLRRLILNGLGKLVSLPQLPDSLLFLDAENCESLERLDCSFHNPDICLNFRNCFKLNQEARDLIIQASIRTASVFPGGEVPAYFSYRATSGTLTVKLNEKPPNKYVRFKACIALGDDVDADSSCTYHFYASYSFKDKHNSLKIPCRPSYHSLPPALGHTIPGHLYTFEFEAYVTSDELIFEIQASSWPIKECGLRQLS